MRKAAQKGLTYEDQLNEVIKSLPSGQVSTLIEVANTVAYLLTDAATNIVRESVKISGGNVL